MQQEERTLDLSPVTLEGMHVRLEPLTKAHRDALVEAARDGGLWKLNVTRVPSQKTMAAYIDAALAARDEGRQLPFAIIHRGSGNVAGSSRFCHIEPADLRVEIGYTWLAATFQRTSLNTEAKLLMLTHAFETWGCVRVEFLTDVLNERSRNALVRIGAREEGVLRYHMIMPDGRYRDSVCYSIIAPEWAAVKAALRARLR
ncbi:MAG: GNAT family protein [Deltaproteobacteria bacterium]|nr:GNAT family protein [Deltaproteobacteria bacterium]